MNKYELALDIAEYPEKYTSEQLAEILSDSETREIYNLLCKTHATLESCNEIDVDAEWEDFLQKHSVHHRSFLWFGSRAASITFIVGSSIVAVAAGLAVTMAVIDHKPEPIAGNVTVAPSVEAISTDSITAQNDSDSVTVSLTPITFEDQSLEMIMKEVADAYGVEIKFNNKEAASLHLYYKFDPSLPLKEIVEQLNTFEQINIRQNGNILNID